MIIDNFSDLEAIVYGCVMHALIVTTDEIYDVLQSKIDAYYAEYKPWKYIRTGDLENALIKTVPEKKDGYYSCMVGFEDDYLTFQYPGAPDWDKNIPATGANVLYYFNNKSHGGTIRGKHKYWDEAIDEINATHGSIEDLFIKNIKASGLPI